MTDLDDFPGGDRLGRAVQRAAPVVQQITTRNGLNGPGRDTPVRWYFQDAARILEASGLLEEGSQPEAPPFTEAEHDLTQALGRCFTDYATIVRNTGGTEDDINEFKAYIHNLQHAVMARALHRLWPEEYRA